MTRRPCGSSDKEQLDHNTKLLQVPDSELQLRASTFSLTTPVKTVIHSVVGGGVGGVHCRHSKLLKKVLLWEPNLTGEKEKRKPRAKTLSAAFISHQLCRWRQLSGWNSKAFTGGNGTATHIQPQLAANGGGRESHIKQRGVYELLCNLYELLRTKQSEQSRDGT